MNTISEQVRNDVYQHIVSELSPNRRMVYMAIKNTGHATINDIQAVLHWGKNQLSGRITELRKMFLIRAVATADGNLKSGQYTVWEVVEDDAVRLNLMEGRIKEAEDIIRHIDCDMNEFISMTSKIILEKEKQKVTNELSKIKSLKSELYDSDNG